MKSSQWMEIQETKWPLSSFPPPSIDPVEPIPYTISCHNSCLRTRYVQSMTWHFNLYFVQMMSIWDELPIRISSIKPTLAYSSDEHGVSLTTFFNRVDKYEPNILVIRNTNKEVTGHFCVLPLFATILSVPIVPYLQFEGVWSLLLNILGSEEHERWSR